MTRGSLPSIVIAAQSIPAECKLALGLAADLQRLRS